MENKDSTNSGLPSAIATDVAFATLAGDEVEATVAAAAAAAESLPMAYATVAVAAPVASMPMNKVPRNSNYDNDDSGGDDKMVKYATYDYCHDDNFVVHEATDMAVASPPTTKIPHNTPYTTPYDAEMERRIAEEATRRGRMLSEQEIQDIRRINCNANAMNNQEQQRVALANQNALYQNYKEETGLTQTSSTMPCVAVAVPASTVKDSEYFAEGTYGKGGYEINEYETSTYETTDYKCTEYKSVYDV